MERDFKEVFEEIDEAIESSIGKMPVPFDKSEFKKRYEEIKKKYLKN